MIDQTVMEQYARLAVTVGVNVQTGQILKVNASVENRELVREIVKQGYLAGAKRVSVTWMDSHVDRTTLLNLSSADLTDIPKWRIDENRFFVDEHAAMLTIVSPVPDVFNGVDPAKLQALTIANQQKMPFLMEYAMSGRGQWSIIAAPNKPWASKVFPHLPEDETYDALWDAILTTSRVTKDNDPVKEWNKHNRYLSKRNDILTNYAFDKLHFTNALGTDIEIKLVKNHVWLGGGGFTTSNVFFNPNIPTEENFTMPHKTGVNGIVYATRPLDYQGYLIEDFWLRFADGTVVEYGAKQNEAALANILNTDEGARHLGEIALIPHDSPISKLGILFYNTLFDENASCHMALGRAIPDNIRGGNAMSPQELEANGYNHSMTHVDFMFGSRDLKVIGTTKDGTRIEVFNDGNFVI